MILLSSPLDDSEGQFLFQGSAQNIEKQQQTKQPYKK